MLIQIRFINITEKVEVSMSEYKFYIKKIENKTLVK